MPSSNKTSHLKLNKWLGSDKPKRDDLNNDNAKIDEACRLLEQSVALLESAMKSGDTTNSQAISSLSATVASHTSSIASHTSSISSTSSSLSSHTGNSAIHVTQAEKTAWSNNSTSLSSHTGNSAIHVTQADKTAWSNNSTSLSSHTGNSAIHVTQAEKNAWSSNSGAVIGSYTGNGNATQKITLGYQPIFVLIFPVDDGFARVNWTSQMFAMNGGCITNSGSTYGMSLNSDGFTVEFRAGGIDGYQIKHNASGVRYVYLAFKA